MTLRPLGTPSAVVLGLQFGDILPDEEWWRDRYGWLEERGYRMRPRYKPGWVKPWKTPLQAIRHPDAFTLPHLQIMDVVRISDGRFVALKQNYEKDNPDEVYIHRMFGTGTLAGDPRNHCIPLYDVFEVPTEPGFRLLAMPFAGAFDNPGWDTVGEAVDCIRQVVEGICFMHEHHVAHRDCNGNNIMMDPTAIFPDSFHPVQPQYSREGKGVPKTYTRTLYPPRYWLIDFGLSRLYPPENGPPRDLILGGDRSVPEYNADMFGLHDPFPVDVYYIGNWIVEEFIIKYKYGSFYFLSSLAGVMCAADPTRRPRMTDVLRLLDAEISRLSAWRLRSRPVPLDETLWQRPFRALAHGLRLLFYVLTCTPAIPHAPPPDVLSEKSVFSEAI